MSFWDTVETLVKDLKQDEQFALRKTGSRLILYSKVNAAQNVVVADRHQMIDDQYPFLRLRGLDGIVRLNVDAPPEALKGHLQAAYNDAVARLHRQLGSDVEWEKLCALVTGALGVPDRAMPSLVVPGQHHSINVAQTPGAVSVWMHARVQHQAPLPTPAQLQALKKVKEALIELERAFTPRLASEDPAERDG